MNEMSASSSKGKFGVLPFDNHTKKKKQGKLAGHRLGVTVSFAVATSPSFIVSPSRRKLTITVTKRFLPNNKQENTPGSSIIIY